MRGILRIIGQLFSYLFPLSVWQRIQNLNANIYSGYLKRRFSSFGTDSYIYYPAFVLHDLQNISIGSNSSIGKEIQLTSWQGGHITIGDDCIIRAYAHITAANSITIGNGLLTGTNVLITDNSHGSFTHEHLSMQPGLRPIVSKGPVVIGNNVWLGNNVCIMPGVTIGDGVVVGANSVVTHDIPAYSMAAGIPAKIIKQLS